MMCHVCSLCGKHTSFDLMLPPCCSRTCHVKSRRNTAGSSRFLCQLRQAKPDCSGRLTFKEGHVHSTIVANDTNNEHDKHIQGP